MEKKMKNGYKVSELLKYNSFFLWFYILARNLVLYLKNKIISDETFLTKKFLKNQGYPLDLKNPKTLNEKIQWIKINDHKDYYTKLADKYEAREYIKDAFGEEYLVPLVFHSTNYKELIPENFPEYPFVLKTNHGFGNSIIVRDKSKVDWKILRLKYKRWLSMNYYYLEREWQYKNMKPRLIAEKMLLTNQGGIPNDYKLNFIEGKLEFIYVSVDREGTNKRNIYDPEWKPLKISWARKGRDLTKIRGEEIIPPPTLQKMIEFGSIVAKLYKFVRVDFYDVEGALYFGEITQSHGGGFDQMSPYEYDLMYGQKIDLSTI